MMGLQPLLQAIAGLLPPWALATLGVLIAALYLPIWMRGVREKQVRGLIRRAFSARREDRPALHAAALERAGDDDILLEVCAREALRRDQRELADAALARLAARGVHDRVKIIRGEHLTPRGPAPELEIVAIRGMLDEGVWGLAAARLDELERRAPGHAAVTALREELAARQAAGVPTPPAG